MRSAQIPLQQATCTLRERACVGGIERLTAPTNIHSASHMSDTGIHRDSAAPTHSAASTTCAVARARGSRRTSEKLFIPLISHPPIITTPLTLKGVTIADSRGIARPVATHFGRAPTPVALCGQVLTTTLATSSVEATALATSAAVASRVGSPAVHLGLVTRKPAGTGWLHATDVSPWPAVVAKPFQNG